MNINLFYSIPIRPKGITKRNEISRWQRREEKNKNWIGIGICIWMWIAKTAAAAENDSWLFDRQTSTSTSSARGTSISDNIFILVCAICRRSMNITNLFIYTMCTHTHTHAHTICTSDAVHHFLRLGRFFCSLGSSSTDSFWGTYIQYIVRVQH